MTRPRRLAILAQWSSAMDVPAHVHVHLEGLRPLVDRLILVSNSPIDQASRLRISNICDVVVERENQGWDFGAWRDVLAMEDPANWDHVILTNSSVIGPLHPLEPIVELMERRKVDFWGMIQSQQHTRHLQSYFMSFSKEVITSNAWREFWVSVADTRDKSRVIRENELGLSRTLIRSGFKIDSWVPFQAFPNSFRWIPLLGRPALMWIRFPYDVNYMNRSLLMHQELIKSGFPYLKASLVWGDDRWLLRSIEEIASLSRSDFPWQRLGLNSGFVHDG